MSGLSIKAPTERSMRLVAGLVMFAYVTCHFLSHAFGLFGLPGVQAIGRGVVLAPWRTPPGLVLLLGAFLVHVALGLRGLYRRRHLRMPAIEAWQFALGFTIPLMLTPHVVDARLGVLLYGLEDSYMRVLYRFWVTDPRVELTSQFTLLAVVWTHGCIGVHMWLRYRDWYHRRRRVFALAALGLPALAVLGVVNAGWDTALRAAVEPGFAAAHGPPAAGSPLAAAGPSLAMWTGRLQLLYLAALAATLALRAARGWRQKRAGSFHVDYRDGRGVSVPLGYSVLEASRSAGIRHASACGGRGRCSTCRVQIWSGGENLPPADAAELSTLRRVGAPEHVRLACQLRPRGDVGVALLARPGRLVGGPGVGFEAGRELVVTAVFVDLRDSTRLSAGRLPFDAMYVVNRFVQAVSDAIVAGGGHVTSVAGDGVMSVFGLDGDPRAGARRAIAAAEAVWRAIDEASAELVPDIGSPLRFGMGVHTGLSIVGEIGAAGHSSLQFLGDTGNVAARLEGLTKETGCTAIISEATLEAAGWGAPGGRRATLDIRGRGQIAAVLLETLAGFAPPAPA